MSRVVQFMDSLLTQQTPDAVKGSFLPRVREGTFPTSLDVCQDGYPSGAKVEEITLIAGVRCREWLHDVFPDLWASVSYGHVEVTDTEDERTIYVATGGWSGCEQVINAVRQHFFLRAYLDTSTRGGGYTFVVPHQ